MTTEQHTPQVSKKENAITDIHAYLVGFVGALLPPGTKIAEDAPAKLRKSAESIYRIVKRAEGFDV